MATERWRCLATGCNPALNEASATEHKAETGHRVALWPVRSAEGERRAHIRNRTGYYDKYNHAGAVASRPSPYAPTRTMFSEDEIDSWDDEMAFGEDDF